MVLVIAGLFSPAEDLERLTDELGILADACVVRITGDGAPAPGTFSLPALSGALGELIEATFPDRRVVVLGDSIGAVVALGVRAANLARIVALEPPLIGSKLWPIVGPLREQLRKTRDPGARALIFELFGVDEAQQAERSYLPVLDGMATPVDVVLGESPLQPQRELDRFPSLVDATERRLLAENPRVRLHVAPGAGHNLVAEAPKVVANVLAEACRRAAATVAYNPLALDEALFEATPLTARAVLYWGAEGTTFRSAFLSMNPEAEVVAIGDDSDVAASPAVEGGFDAVVLATRPSAERLARLASLLRKGGHLIARWGGEDAAAAAELARNDLALREPVDDGGGAVLRAQKLGGGDAPRPALHIQMAALAPLMMDIRTRLPTRALRSDPELRVAYDTLPFKLPPGPPGVPKVLVLQRPIDSRVEFWLSFIAKAIRYGWVVVMEYDDHPLLVAELRGLPNPGALMTMLGFAHAVQTSTPPLVDAFRPFNPEVAMFPNAALDIMPFPEGDRPARVFYGGVIRGRYAIDVARSLGPAIERSPDTEFVVIGDEEVFAALPTQAKRYYSYMSYEAYLGLMSQCAISLSPIAPLAMRETKSDAKFVEAARSGALTIGSPIIYDRVIAHGVNGFLAPEIEDWAPLLSHALTDQALRSRMARQAWDHVCDHRMFADQVALRRDWYRDLWSRRSELNASLMQRMPGLRELISA